MNINEYPDSITGTQLLIDNLLSRIEQEPDKEKRRELWLLKIELRDHIIQLGLQNQTNEVINRTPHF